MRLETRHRHPTSAAETARVAKGGILGAVPGLLLIGVPVLLAELDVITADQSQIGFLGVPLMILGIFAGTMLEAGGHDTLPVLGGVGAGLLLGLVVGGTLAANGVLPGLWLILVPAAMITGGAATAHRCSRKRSS